MQSCHSGFGALFETSETDDSVAAQFLEGSTPKENLRRWLKTKHANWRNVLQHLKQNYKR